MSSRRGPKPRRATRVTIPAGVTPIVRVIFEEMSRQRIPYDELEYISGVMRTTIKAWRKKNRPALESIEAALGALGWTLTPLPQERVLPAELVATLRPVAEQFGLTMAETVAALLEVVGQSRARFEKARARQRPSERRQAPAVQRRVGRPAVPGQTFLFGGQDDAAA